MERRAFFISLGLSVFAMYLVYQYIAGEDERLEALYGEANYATMVVATRDVLQFQTIRQTDVEIQRFPSVALSPGLISNPADVIDAVAAVPISKGEFILDNKIISKNIYSGLDSQVTGGKRAISLPVTAKKGVGYLIQPGNRVDLAAHFEFKTGRKNISEVKIFMQDVLVLAAGKTIQKNPPKGVDQDIVDDVVAKVDQMARDINEAKDEVRETLNYAKSEQEYQTITIEVTPEQSQQLVYIMTVFQDSLIAFLRHADDRMLQRLGTMNMDKIMGRESYYVQSKRPGTPPPRRVPKYYDYIGGRAVPVY